MPQPAFQSDNISLYWDRCIIADRTIEANAPDIVVVDRSEWRVMIVYIMVQCEKVKLYIRLVVVTFCFFDCIYLIRVITVGTISRDDCLKEFVREPEWNSKLNPIVEQRSRHCIFKEELKHSKWKHLESFLGLFNLILRLSCLFCYRCLLFSWAQLSHHDIFINEWCCQSRKVLSVLNLFFKLK